MFGTDRKYQSPSPEVTTWISAPRSTSRCMTAWQRVEFPRPRPFTKKRIRAGVIRREPVGRQEKRVEPERPTERASPFGARSSRTSFDRIDEFSGRGRDETDGTPLRA